MLQQVVNLNACLLVCVTHMHAFIHARKHTCGSPWCIDAAWVYLIVKPAAACSCELALQLDHGSGTRCDMQMDINVWPSALNHIANMLLTQQASEHC